MGARGLISPQQPRMRGQLSAGGPWADPLAGVAGVPGVLVCLDVGGRQTPLGRAGLSSRSSSSRIPNPSPPLVLPANQRFVVGAAKESRRVH